MYGCLSHTALLGTWSTTQACALTGNQTDDPSVLYLALNPLSHTSQGRTCSLVSKQPKVLSSHYIPAGLMAPLPGSLSWFPLVEVASLYRNFLWLLGSEHILRRARSEGYMGFISASSFVHSFICAFLPSLNSYWVPGPVQGTRDTFKQSLCFHRVYCPVGKIDIKQITTPLII